MKKQLKKLVLSRETIRHLSVLERAAGGGTTGADDPMCTQSAAPGCEVITPSAGCDPSITCALTCNCNSNRFACFNPPSHAC
jgi:hypothetical protein